MSYVDPDASTEVDPIRYDQYGRPVESAPPAEPVQYAQPAQPVELAAELGAISRWHPDA